MLISLLHDQKGNDTITVYADSSTRRSNGLKRRPLQWVQDHEVSFRPQLFPRLVLFLLRVAFFAVLISYLERMRMENALRYQQSLTLDDVGVES